MTYDPNNPVRDTSGRLLDVGPDATDEEIEAAKARRDELDAANLARLRAAGRIFNAANYSGENSTPDPFR